MISRTTRILVVTSTFPRWENDTEPAFVFNLCKYLSVKGLDVDVLAPHAPGAKKHEIMEGINVYRYRYFIGSLQTLAYSGGILANLKQNPLNYFLVPFFVVSQLRALWRQLKVTRYQLIHAHWLIPQGAVCAFVNIISGQKAPALICTSHGGDLYALDNFLFTAIKKWAINNCDHFCVVSNAMKNTAIRMGTDRNRISVMPMGVDLANQFRPVPGINRNLKKLIFVGRLVEKKGVTHLLDAMAIVIKSVPEAELLIVGEGPLRETLEQQSAQQGLNRHVEFRGGVPHHLLPELFSSAGIAVIPSVVDSAGDQEGLGLVIVEAMGCGCAVIASSLDAIRDIIDSGSGMLITPGDSLKLAKNICLLLSDQKLCQTMAARGRARVIEKFDLQVSGERYLRLMHNYAEHRTAKE